MNIVKRILIIVVFVVVVFLTIFLSIDKDDDFRIYIFNAGKADASIISCNNKYIMIDTGEESLSDEILTYFNENNIKKLDYLIITHFDKDHVGSASKILDNIEIGRVLSTNTKKDSIYYNNYIDSLNSMGIIPLIVTGDYEFTVSGIDVIVNGPDKIYEKNESNNSSLIIDIEYGNNKFLFMGDSENDRIKDFISLNSNQYDFIKMPYHGNYLKKLDDLLEDVKPKYAVITSNKEDEKTINLLDESGVIYYITNNGSISILSNGNDIIIEQ